MFVNNYLKRKSSKRDVFSPEVKAQLDGLYVMLEERYGEAFAASIMEPYITFQNQSRH